jgi:1,4-alpha-glucan branching enzyme
MLHKQGIVSLVGGMVLAFAAFAGCASSGSVTPEKENVFSVLFTYAGQHESICLAGDFNDWSLDSHCLKRHGDEWQISLSLFPGRYRYGFVLDGKCCSPDPDGVLQESDGFGGESSILIVE